MGGLQKILIYGRESTARIVKRTEVVVEARFADNIERRTGHPFRDLYGRGAIRVSRDFLILPPL